jgi:hypothetical protein
MLQTNILADYPSIDEAVEARQKAIKEMLDQVERRAATKSLSLKVNGTKRSASTRSATGFTAKPSKTMQARQTVQQAKSASSQILSGSRISEASMNREWHGTFRDKGRYRACYLIGERTV